MDMKDNTGSDDYGTRHYGGVKSGVSKGMSADQDMNGSKQAPKRQSSNQSKGMNVPAHRGTVDR